MSARDVVMARQKRLAALQKQLSGPEVDRQHEEEEAELRASGVKGYMPIDGPPGQTTDFVIHYPFDQKRAIEAWPLDDTL
jgi:hypothetical protein